MILIIRDKMFLITGILICAVLVLTGLWSRKETGVLVNEPNYRVFVAGLGTVEGRWSGQIGIAIIGLETRSAAAAEEEQKVLDLLVANQGSAPVQFDADITLIDPQGRRYGLKAREQPAVQINPGTLSQGTVIINVPKGNPDENWTVEIKGGNLKDGVILPLRVVKVKG